MTKQQRTDKRGRTLREAGVRRELIEAFKGSGQSQAAFCRERGLNPATFCGWLRTSRKARFAEVTVPVMSGIGVEVQLPNGVKVRVLGGGTAAQTAELIRRVAGC
jgi:hypothetical protein